MTYPWGVFLADLEPVVGREQGLRRPVLVISAEPLNQHYDVVTIVPITSRKNQRPPVLAKCFCLLEWGDCARNPLSYAIKRALSIRPG